MFRLSIKHLFKLTLPQSRCLLTDSTNDNILSGKGIAERLLSKCQNDCEEFVKKYQRRPRLVAILVGGNESSKLYVRNKQRAAEYVGIDFHVIHHLMHLTSAHLTNSIEQLNHDETVDGILLQLPLPLHLIEKTEQFIDTIRIDKDVDAHTTMNNHTYRHASVPLVTIPVVAAVRELLLNIGEPLHGKNAVVVGRSRYVGTPLALMLSQSATDAKNDLISGATVTICHRDTQRTELAWYCKHADLVISAVGRPKLITSNMIKEGAIVIDVGISKSSGAGGKQRFVGDVDFHEVQSVARWITPVPGGVGPLTVACLISNLIKLARHRRE